jgi:CYTH domain-containing protein
MVVQRIGKYACLETERRYLLQELPDSGVEYQNGWLITDRYFPQTRLRLRHLKSVTGTEVIFKLTQKYRAETQTADETTITNLYLTEAEYNLFSSLAANTITKKRYPCRVQDHHFSLDVFEGRHRGLILAEREMEAQAKGDEAALPLFALREVTDDPFFLGGNLACLTEEEFRQGFAERLGDRHTPAPTAA